MPDETKAKKTVRRRTKKADASSPIPCGPGQTCGHDGCEGGMCRVRYVGPVSHMRDHFAMHAARGSAHIWAAAVTTGLAVVLTGAIALTAVEAKQNEREAALSRQAASRADVERLMNKLERVERLVDETRGMLLKQMGPESAEEIMKSTLPVAEEVE